jgi:hypothetical protein
VEQHWRQGDPSTRGRFTERHLFLQRLRQQEVLLGIQNRAVGSYTSRQSRARRRTDDVQRQVLLLVTDASCITAIIGVATSLILIVIGGFKSKIER